MEITPILTGNHAMEVTPNGVDIYKHNSAVTLIRTEEKNILVDTGGRGTIVFIESKLQELGLKFSDIHIVILTHFHLDHSYNISYFPNAKVFGWMHEWKIQSTFRFEDIEKVDIAKGISLLKTPGHTPEHLSVVVTQDNKKVVIAGDAINEKFVKTGKPGALFYDEQLYMESAKKIMTIADVIIPGHGSIITLEK